MLTKISGMSWTEDWCTCIFTTGSQTL